MTKTDIAHRRNGLVSFGSEIQEQDERARSLVLRFGWNSTCYQVLNPGIERWISPDGTGLVGYVRAGKTLVVAGAPVCAAENLRATLDQWEAFAARERGKICYFGAEGRLRDCVDASGGYQTVCLGWQPEWTPTSFIQRIDADASLRAQLNRASNKGIRVTEWTHDEAKNNPQLRAALADWLSTRGLPTLHFLVEPNTLSDLRDRRIFVASRGESVVGFVTLCPVPTRNGWLTEQFVRSRLAPNGTVELMLFHAITAIRDSGAEYVTMGLAPLADRDLDGPDPNPRWLQGLRAWARAHGNRFYNFRGLETFKAKFHPDSWCPVVAVVKDDTFRVRHLRGIAAAFTRGLPEIAVLTGIYRALKSELARLVRFARRVKR